MVDGFIFYESFRDATKELEPDTRLAVYDAIMDYALYGVMPDGITPAAMACFKLIRPQLDANARRRENGKKGGRAPADREPKEGQDEPNDDQTDTESEATNNQDATKDEPNHNQTQTDSKPKEKEKEKAKGEMVNGKGERYPRGFSEFWSAYPRKEGKDAAAKAFAKRKPDAALLALMLEAIARQKATPQWRKDGGQFIPHPATWLNQGRWMDEVPTTTNRHGYTERILTDADLAHLIVDLDGGDDGKDG